MRYLPFLLLLGGFVCLVINAILWLQRGPSALPGLAVVIVALAINAAAYAQRDKDLYD